MTDEWHHATLSYYDVCVNYLINLQINIPFVRNKALIFLNFLQNFCENYVIVCDIFHLFALGTCSGNTGLTRFPNFSHDKCLAKQALNLRQQ